MGRRQNLQDELESLFGNAEIVFQPPSSVKLKYPCIIYSRTAGDTLRANDALYRYVDKYTVIAISRDPDNLMAKTIIKSFPNSRYVRRYIKDNLYHDLCEIYY